RPAIRQQPASPGDSSLAFPEPPISTHDQCYIFILGHQQRANCLHLRIDDVDRVPMNKNKAGSGEGPRDKQKISCVERILEEQRAARVLRELDLSTESLERVQILPVQAGLAALVGQRIGILLGSLVRNLDRVEFSVL